MAADSIDGIIESGKTSALKITLPESLLAEISGYAESQSRSKSDLIADLVRQALTNDWTFQRRMYFFPKRAASTGRVVEPSLLTDAPMGTLIKVAGAPSDAPSLARLLVCNLLKVAGNLVYFEIPATIPRMSPLLEYNPTELQSVSLRAGALVFPKQEVIAGIFGPYHQYVYAVDISYIWDVDTHVPGAFV